MEKSLPIKQRHVILLILMIGSVLVRLPSLNRPISKHHEFNTAFFLIPMEMWQHDGILNHGMLPPYTYPGKANRNLLEPIIIFLYLLDHTGYPTVFFN